MNIAAGKDLFVRWAGHAPREPAPVEADPAAPDTVIAHPAYGTAGWLAVVNPGKHTERALRELLRAAHGLARARHERRAGSTTR